MALRCIRCDFTLPPNKMQCPACKIWQNSPMETAVGDESVLLADVTSSEQDRIDVKEFNYCWGGGLSRGSVTLFGGLPGAGKSTVLLQILQRVWEFTQQESMYIATEEALPDIRSRADRLQIKAPIRMVPAMSGVADVGALLLKRKPIAVVLDSLQGMTGTDEHTAIELLKTLKKFGVTLNAPIIVISHVNKEGDYAGLMTYQHAVDTLFLMDPDESGQRTLEVQKNRYGRAFIESVFEMTEHGLIHILGDEEEEIEENE